MAQYLVYGELVNNSIGFLALVADSAKQAVTAFFVAYPSAVPITLRVQSGEVGEAVHASVEHE